MDFQYTTDVTRIYHTNYVRNSRAVAMIWGIFTLCFAILNIVAFIQPQWIGDTVDSPNVGFFGLYEYCERIQYGGEYSCQGSFLDFSSILSDHFRAASFFVGISAMLFLVCVLCMLLFFVLNTATVLTICAWIQTISAVFMFLGCVIYPGGWNQEKVRLVCGDNAIGYSMDRCGIRWAYILAIILIFDAAILAALAFILAHKQMKLLPEVYGHARSEFNGYSTDTMSKRSVPIQPVLSISDHDAFSEISQRSEKSKRSSRDHYHL